MTIGATATGVVEAVCASATHTFTKATLSEIRLLAGVGVEGDAHAGHAVKHRSRVARDPTSPNSRQLHLIHGELIDQLRDRGFPVYAGAMGENVTTRAIPILELPLGTRLRLGNEAVIELTGLRNPCAQLDRFAPGLMAAVLQRADDGGLVRLAGVMAIVVSGGAVRPGDAIVATLPPAPHRQLEPV